MTWVLIEHEIDKWADFEEIFREDGERRRMLGSLGGQVFRRADNPLNVFIALEWDGLENARRFVEGFETSETMKWATAGASSRIHVTEEVFSVDA